MSSGKKKSSVASRYLAAIHCPADPMVPVISPTDQLERSLSPQTAPWNNEMDSFGSSKQSSIVQTRSTGNSPSSSRKSRASRTPPRDSVSSAVDISLGCTSIPQLRPTGFFPATTSGLVATAKEMDTDGSSSLTNSRSSTPPLHDEDDPAALFRKEQRKMLKMPYQLHRATPVGRDWRDRMDGTANYKGGKWSKKKATPRNFPSSREDSLTRQQASSPLDGSDEAAAPTEVMMNLSSVRQQPRRSPDTMSNVTGTSTEIITNRSADLHRKLLHNVDERDSSEPKQRPQHESVVARRRSAAHARSSGRQKWPPATPGIGRKKVPYQQRSFRKPPQTPIEINSLLSDTSITEGTEESSGWVNAPLYPGSMPMGRLGQHVGQDKLSENMIFQKRQVQRQNSLGSLQDQSFTSSVGVETGVHVVSKSEPALKRVFKETQPHAGITFPANQRMNPQSSPSDIALTRPLPPQHEERATPSEEVNYRPPRIGEFPPRAPQSDEKQSSISSNPFMVKYSARGASAAERRGLYDMTIGSPQSTGSSGGWTPVPLSSSGMFSEDFILDPNHTPLGKDEQPITALFSPDRLPSSSKSTLENFYRSDPSNEESCDSVGPPIIHRVTADHPVESVHLSGAAPRDAPGAIADDDEAEEDENDLIPGLTPDIQPPVDSPQAVSVPAPTFQTEKIVNNYNGKQLKSLPLNQSRKRALMLRRRRLTPGKAERHDVDEHDVESLKDVVTLDTKEHECGVSSAAELPVSRNLFPAEEEHDINDGQERYREDSAAREQPVGIDTVDDLGVATVRTNVDDMDGNNARDFEGFDESPSQSCSVQDGARSLSPSKEMPQEYVPPWKAKLKGKGSVGKVEQLKAGEDEQQTQKYIPPWKQKLLKQRSATKLVSANANVNEEGAVCGKPEEEYVPPWRLKLMAEEKVTTDNVPDANATEDPASQDATLEHIPSWKLKLVEKEASIKDGSSHDIFAGSKERSNEYVSPWKRKAMARESATNSSPVENASLQNIPKWKLELMKKKGFVKEDESEEILCHQKVVHEKATDALEMKSPPRKSSLTVRERVKALSDSKKPTHQFVPPWVAKASRSSRKEQDEAALVVSVMKSQGGNARTINAIQSAPPRLSRQDRAVAMSRESHESSFVTTGSARSKRSFSETLDESSQSIDLDLPKDGESPNKAMKTSQHPHRTRVMAKLLGAVSAHVDPSVASGAGESKTNDANSPRKSMVLAAHLAATVDEVSPQDRYRGRFRHTDETTATGGSREKSDVQSLKSFFEASHATLPSDEESDDRTVESLRSKFEPIPKKEEEEGEVRKMRAMFEKPKPSGGGRNESGGSITAVSDAISKFKPSTKRWTPPTKEGARRTIKPLKGPACISPDNARAGRTSSPREGAVVSAPSKLESRPRPARSPPPKPEDMFNRRWSHERFDTLNKEERDVNSPKVLSVAERILALTLKQSPHSTDDKEEELPSAAAARNAKEEVTEMNRTSPPTVMTSKWKKPVKTIQSMPRKREVASRDPPEGDRDERIHTANDIPPKAKPPAGAYPSVKDRVNAFSRGKSGQSKADMDISSQSTARGRKSWPSENRKIRHIHSQQVMSIPSDERTGSGMAGSDKPVKQEQQDASSVGTNGTESEYDDGVTLDLSIAEISQLTNPTCIQSKEGGAASSSDGDDSSEHTSDVNRGSNVEGKHPSEASSSQTSEAAAPLIARMKFSDDASNSVGSAKGAFPGRSRTVHSRWEPLTPVVDEAEPARHSPDGTRESAWSPDEIASTFPVESSFDSAAEKRDKTSWHPFQVENWDSSPSYGTNWTPPSNTDPIETTISEATSFARVSEDTPVRRNTTVRASPPQQRSSPYMNTKRSPTQGSLFSRTHPTRSAGSLPLSPSFPATPRSSPVKVESAPTSGGLSSPTTGISKHALLMSKLRSLKEARIRRNAVAGFHRTSVYPSERPASERHPTGNYRASPTPSALAPFLRPGFEKSPSRPSTANRYPDRLPTSSPRTVDDEQSLSTKSSTQFGGNKFVESLELD